MKFLFESPVLAIEAPVLSDRQMMYKVLKQNSACVLLECVLADVKKPDPLPQQQEQQHVEYVHQQQEYVQTQNDPVNASQVMVAPEGYSLDMPKLPAGTIIIPQDGSVQMYDSQGEPQQYYEIYQTSDLLDAFPQQEFVTAPGKYSQDLNTGYLGTTNFY
jgi:hypothetical protein